MIITFDDIKEFAPFGAETIVPQSYDITIDYCIDNYFLTRLKKYECGGTTEELREKFATIYEQNQFIVKKIISLLVYSECLGDNQVILTDFAVVTGQSGYDSNANAGEVSRKREKFKNWGLNLLDDFLNTIYGGCENKNGEARTKIIKIGG